jgi:hypothetical protein
MSIFHSRAAVPVAGISLLAVAPVADTTGLPESSIAAISLRTARTRRTSRAELKNWRKIRSSPAHATTLVDAIQTLIIES